MLQACFDPAMTCEITLQPVRRHGVDAAIFFSDIVIPLAAAGVDIDIVPGVGPVVAEPIRDQAGLAAFPELTPDRREDRGGGPAHHRRAGPGRRAHRIRRRAVHPRFVSHRGRPEPQP